MKRHAPVVAIACFVFIMTDLQAVVRKKRNSPERLKAKMTLLVRPSIDNLDSANPKKLVPIYNRRVSIALGKKRYFKAKDHIIELIMRPSKDDPARYMMLKIKVLKRSGSIDEAVMSSRTLVPYRRKTAKHPYFRLSKGIKKTRKDKFGTKRLVFKLAAR